MSERSKEGTEATTSLGIEAPRAENSLPEGGAAGAKVGRRGLMRRAAGASAAAALLLTAKEAAPAEAAARATLEGASTADYGAIASPGGPVTGVTIPQIGATDHGVIGSNTAATVLPFSSGVAGARIGDGRVGVLGANGTAGFGVYGVSQSGVGTAGVSDTLYGVYGNANAAAGDTAGVFGSSPAKGIWGRTTAGFGILGQATANGGIGVYGTAPTAVNTWAGYFEGHVFISGGLAGGNVARSFAPGRDGGPRALYSLDTAEPVVEDFGEGSLSKGQAVVALDGDFVAVAEGGAYQVFLTAYGDLGSLYVAGRTSTAFTVQSSTGATGGFGFRVVAKRKGASGRRLERLEHPKPVVHVEPKALLTASPPSIRRAGADEDTPVRPPTRR